MTVKIFARFYRQDKEVSVFTERVFTNHLIIEDGRFKIKCPGYLVNMITRTLPDRIELIFREFNENGSLIDGEVVESYLYLSDLNSRSLISMDINF